MPSFVVYINLISLCRYVPSFLTKLALPHCVFAGFASVWPPDLSYSFTMNLYWHWVAVGRWRLLTPSWGGWRTMHLCIWGWITSWCVADAIGVHVEGWCGAVHDDDGDEADALWFFLISDFFAWPGLGTSVCRIVDAWLPFDVNVCLLCSFSSSTPSLTQNYKHLPFSSPLMTGGGFDHLSVAWSYHSNHNNQQPTPQHYSCYLFSLSTSPSIQFIQAIDFLALSGGGPFHVSVTCSYHSNHRNQPINSETTANFVTRLTMFDYRSTLQIFYCVTLHFTIFTSLLYTIDLACGRGVVRSFS